MDETENQWLLVDVIEYEAPKPEAPQAHGSRWAKNSVWMRAWNKAFDAAHNAHHAARNETCLMEKTDA